MEKWDHEMAEKAADILCTYLSGFGADFQWIGISADTNEMFGDGQHFVKMTLCGRYQISVDLSQEFVEKLIWKIKEAIRGDGERIVEDMLELGIIDKEMLVDNFAGCVSKGAERVRKLLKEKHQQEDTDDKD